MDKLLEDDNFSGSDLDDDPDNMEVPGCGVSLLPPPVTDFDLSDITQYLTFNTDSISQSPPTENVQSSFIQPTNHSITNIQIPQTQITSNPTQISTPTVKKISVNVNGKILKLNTEKAVVVTPSLLKSLGGLPNTNNATAALKNLKFVNNNSSQVNNNLRSIPRPQIQIGGQRIIAPPTKQSIPIHPSGKITKTNLKKTVRLDSTSLQSLGYITKGAQPQRFKVVNNVSSNRSILQTSTPAQLNGGVQFQIGPGNELVRVPNPVPTKTPQFRTVGNVNNLPNFNIQRPLLKGTVPNKIGTQPNRFVTIQNGVGTAQTRVGSIPNRFGTTQNKVGMITNRVGQMPAVSSSTNSNGVRFQIGPNNTLLRAVNPPKSGFQQVVGNGRVLTAPNGKTSLSNGRVLLNGNHISPQNPQQLISKIVNSINSGNIENFDSDGIAQLVEEHWEQHNGNGKRKFQVRHDHDYNASWNQKRNTRAFEEEVEDEEELGVAETYSTYMPSKLKLGRKHPDPVVETASLSSVAPVDVWYKLSIPEDTIDSGALSALQLESITYASQAHEQFLPNETRAGFLLGDGAGVGKGRTIAGIILENFLKGRERAVWVSISNDLKYDAERDLADIGAGSIPVHQLNKMKYNSKLCSEANGHIKRGVLFCSYSSLIGESNISQGKYVNRRQQIVQWCGKDFDGVIIFDECHKAKNLCTSGSVKPTKTGKMVLELQKDMPKARVLYASATGASEPKNMAYMVRLGLWGPGTTFESFEDFTAAVEERGVGGMEIVAMDMKLRGAYIARQLSFQDVKFQIIEVELKEDFIKVYNWSVKLWVEALQKFQAAAKLVAANNNMKKSMMGQFWSSHQRFFKYLCMAAKVDAIVNIVHTARKDNKCVVIGLQSTGEARTLDQLEKNDGELTDFVSTAKGVFQSLVERHFPSSNRDNVNKILSNLSVNKKPQPQNGVVKKVDERTLMKRRQIALLASDLGSDSEDSITFDSDEEKEMSDDEMMRIKKRREAEEDVETANNYLQMILPDRGNKRNNLFKAGTKEKEEKKPALPTPADIEEANKMKEELLKRINKLGKKLPKNTLDELIDNLGGPEEVAEMTGRKGRVVQTDNGIQYESRSEQDVPLETLNVKEKQRFMDGEKYIAIISEAASSGISLQSDRRAINQKKRVHVTVELPWSADKAIQQFGRTHRSNQVSAPEYFFLIADLAGETRFASVVAKRLESLGALTHGDRRASENRDLSQFNIDNKYGKAALESVMKAIVGKDLPFIPPPKDYKGMFFKDVAQALIGVGLIEKKDDLLVLDKDYNQIPKFLNRILGMPVELQNRLFKYFTDTMTAMINRAKREGTFDLGILDLGVGEDEHIKRVKTTTFHYRHATGIAPIELHKLKIEKGMSWNHAMNVYREEVTDENEGFYESQHTSQASKRYVILLTKVKTTRRMYDYGKEEPKYIVYRPNTGRQNKKYTIEEIELKYRKAAPINVKNLWMEQYNSTVCTHVYSNGRCRFGDDCVVGLRVRIYHVLAGSVLPIWQKIEEAISPQPNMKHSSKNKMQVLRLKTTDNRKIVGTLIKNHLVEGLIKVLQQVSESVEEEEFPENTN